jgi:hypothetical protein
MRFLKSHYLAEKGEKDKMLQFFYIKKAAEDVIINETINR